MENEAYLTKQLITYLGNKRSLLDFLELGITAAKKKLGKEKISFADLFSGSGVVSRFAKKDASYILSNDLEGYCRTIALCYLANPDEARLKELYRALLKDMAERPVTDGFIRRLYSPVDRDDIKRGERVFYTPENAEYIDSCRQAIGRLPESDRPYFLAPLLSEASVKCNTSGVFKGFYKDRDTGVGVYGGSGRNALSRITAPISLPFPVFSNYTCPFDASRSDALALASSMEPVDIAYIDPPYNQHPYGSNYFMLNLINDYTEPAAVSPVSGIPKGWNRSDFNSPSKSAETLGRLCRAVPSAFLLISFNSEGFISPSEMKKLLSEVGRVEVFSRRYNVFRGSRNLRERNIHNSEYLYLVDKR